MSHACILDFHHLERMKSQHLSTGISIETKTSCIQKQVDVIISTEANRGAFESALSLQIKERVYFKERIKCDELVTMSFA